MGEIEVCRRMLDVAMVATGVERRNRRLATRVFGDPDIDKVVVVADRKLAEELATEETNTMISHTRADEDSDK